MRIVELVEGLPDLDLARHLGSREGPPLLVENPSPDAPRGAPRDRWKPFRRGAFFVNVSSRRCRSEERRSLETIRELLDRHGSEYVEHRYVSGRADHEETEAPMSHQDLPDPGVVS